MRKHHRRAMVPLDFASVVFFTMGFLVGSATVMLLARFAFRVKDF